MPRNLGCDSPSFSFPLSESETSVAVVVGVSGTGDLGSSVAVVSVVFEGDVGLPTDPHTSAPAVVGDVGEVGLQFPFSRALAFCLDTFSAKRLAAASSCLLVSSGSSFSASRAA